MRRWLLVYAYLSNEQREFVDREVYKLLEKKSNLSYALNSFRCCILKKYLYTPTVTIERIGRSIRDGKSSYTVRIFSTEQNISQILQPGKVNFCFKKFDPKLGLPILDSTTSFVETSKFLKCLETDTNVVIIGSGVAGLASAYLLHKEGIPALLIEACDIGGRLKSCKKGVPLGANYMHCIQSANTDARSRRGSKSLVGLATQLKPKVADTCGGCWESTLYCNWYDYNGNKIDLERVVWMHHLFELTRNTAINIKDSNYMDYTFKSAKLNQGTTFDFTRESLVILYNQLVPRLDSKGKLAIDVPQKVFAFDDSTDDESFSSNGSDDIYTLLPVSNLFELTKTAFKQILTAKNISQNELTFIDFCLFWNIVRTRFGYTSSLDDTSVLMCKIKNDMEMSGEFGTLDGAKKDSKFISANFKQQNNVKIQPFTLNNYSEKVMVEGWDWLINHLSKPIGNNIFINTVVKSVNIIDYETKPSTVAISVSHKDLDDDITITCEYCIVAVSRGALENIEFNPPLEAKKTALSNILMGYHNKLIMEFDELNIFWPKDIIQFNCLDHRFQFMNLHAYGHKGMLLAHLFPPFSINYDSLTDEDVLSECLKTLSLIFKCHVARPKYYKLTRWQNDPFTKGSYSYPRSSALVDDIFMLRAPHPIDNPRILFAGEYLSQSYYQCVDGAYDTGIRAAEELVNKYKNYQHNDVDYDKYIGYYLTDGEDEDVKLASAKDPHVSDMCSNRINWELQLYNHIQNNSKRRNLTDRNIVKKAKKCKCCSYSGPSCEAIEALIYNIDSETDKFNKGYNDATSGTNGKKLDPRDVVMNAFDIKRGLVREMKIFNKKVDKLKRRHVTLMKYINT